LGLIAVVLATIAVSSFITRLRTDPILRRAGFRNQLPADPESTEFAKNGPATLKATSAGVSTTFRFARRLRNGLVKNTGFATR
jgi:hypothetical protein